MAAALAWQTPGCAAQGCGRTITHIDHRVPWAQTRHTTLTELDPLCPHHHDLKTHHGWELTPGTGSRPFVPPDDPRHPTRAPDNEPHNGDPPLWSAS